MPERASSLTAAPPARPAIASVAAAATAFAHDASAGSTEGPSCADELRERRHVVAAAPEGASSPNQRRRRNSGTGSSAAIFARTGRGARSSAGSIPATSAWRRQGWQCDTCAASLRRSRAPSDPVSAPAMIVLDADAARAADELLVLLGQAPARAEQRRLDRRARHPQPRADLAIGQALELAHDEDLVMGLRSGRRTRRGGCRARASGRRRRRASGRCSRAARGRSGPGPRRRRRRPPRSAARAGTGRCTRSWRSRRSRA